MMPATFALPLGRDLNRHIQDRLKNLSPFNEPSQVPQLTTVQLAAMIDHTQLKPEADRAMIEQLCQEAVHYGFASVCVNPFNVPYCAEMLRGSQVAVCTVTGFPLGAAQTRIKVAEARLGIRQGATEVDMVINVGLLKDQAYRAFRRDIAEVASVCHANGAILKVILETCLLSDEEKIAACLLARDAQADFVKTSTGLNSAGATTHDVALMRAVVGNNMGVKAAGGIRNLETALSMVAAGANRIGASSSVKIIEALK